MELKLVFAIVWLSLFRDAPKLCFAAESTKAFELVSQKLENSLSKFAVKTGGQLNLNELREAHVETRDLSAQTRKRMEAEPKYRALMELYKSDIIPAFGSGEYSDSEIMASIARAYHRIRVKQQDYMTSTDAFEKVVFALESFAEEGTAKSGLTKDDLWRAYEEFCRWDPRFQSELRERVPHFDFLAEILHFDAERCNLVDLIRAANEVGNIERLEQIYKNRAPELAERLVRQHNSGVAEFREQDKSIGQ